MEGMLSHNLFLTSRSVLRFRHKSGLAPNHKIWADLDKRARPVFYLSNITRYIDTPRLLMFLLIHPILFCRHEVCALCFSDPPGPQAR